MKFMKSLKYVVMSAVMCVSMASFVGCSDDKTSSSDVNASEDELPYGATMQVLKTNPDCPIEFDKRFLTDDEADAIVDYFMAIQNVDEELALEHSLPFYLDYLTVVSECGDVQEYLEQLNYMIGAGYLQEEEFSFSYINITECSEDQEVLDEVSKGLDAVAAESGEEPVSPRVTSRKAVNVDIVCETENGTQLLSETAGEQIVFIYEIDGKICLV